jgi:cytoskeletal protein CcmA (bactofilin family)
LKPFSRKGTHVPVKPPTSLAFHSEALRRAPPDFPTAPARRPDRSIVGNTDSKRLVIGRDISLSGEITSCDRLIVEGRAEVALSSATTIDVTASGFFKGSAEVEEADIQGRFEGELTAFGLLTVRSGGSVSGRVRYGRVIIESGGEISGDIQSLNGSGGTAKNEKETPAKKK